MTVYMLVVVLFLVGLYGVLTKRNIIKIIIGLGVMEYSINLFFSMIGYVKGGTVPILSEGLTTKLFVDPLPQALVLTSIVIGLATTAMLLAVAIRIYKKYNTFDIGEIKNLKG